MFYNTQIGQIDLLSDISLFVFLPLLYKYFSFFSSHNFPVSS